MALSTPTTDHGIIRTWATSHNAVPAELSDMGTDGEPTILRFLFLDGSLNPQQLQPISWEDFFMRFDLLGLSLAYAENGSEEPANTYEFLQIESKSAYRFSGNPI